MSKKLTLKDLPEEEMAKVKELVHRFTEEKNEKEKYQSMYEKLKKQHEELKRNYEQLDRNHAFMKAQMNNSKMAIIKAK